MVVGVEGENRNKLGACQFHLDGAYDVIEFNKFLVASKLYDTITFYNFWK